MNAVEESFKSASESTIFLAVDSFEIIGPADFTSSDIPIPRSNVSGIQRNGEPLGPAGANGGLDPLYQIGGPRSVQLALKLIF